MAELPAASWAQRHAQSICRGGASGLETRAGGQDSGAGGLPPPRKPRTNPEPVSSGFCQRLPGRCNKGSSTRAPIHRGELVHSQPGASSGLPPPTRAQGPKHLGQTPPLPRSSVGKQAGGTAGTPTGTVWDAGDRQQLHALGHNVNCSFWVTGNTHTDKPQGNTGRRFHNPMGAGSTCSDTAAVHARPLAASANQRAPYTAQPGTALVAKGREQAVGRAGPRRGADQAKLPGGRSPLLASSQDGSTARRMPEGPQRGHKGPSARAFPRH